MRYLDPKNYLTFKKIFGQHPDLLLSLLNALMPLEPGQEILTLEYLTPDMVPAIPEFKHSIVDVRCKDNYNREFIVEMQMLWTSSFKYRVLFNASKAYVKQLKPKQNYTSLHPVYTLCLLNENFTNDESYFYHHFAIVDVLEPALRLDGLEFVFVELPKFTPQTVLEKKMAVLWLRFLTEIDDGSQTAPSELLENKETCRALDILQESAFTPEELDAYDRYWDSIRTELTLHEEKVRLDVEREVKKVVGAAVEKAVGEAVEKAVGEAVEKAVEETELKTELKTKTEMIINCYRNGLDISTIAKITLLSEAEITTIINLNTHTYLG